MPLGRHPTKIVVFLMLMAVIGCERPPDAFLEEFARESLNRQTQQNQEIASQRGSHSRSVLDML